jgi:predicted Zn-dependent peptidase
MHLFGDTPLGRPILGSVESIESLSPATIRRYYRNRYRPEQMVVAAAGNLNHAAVVRQVRSAFARGDVELDPGATVAVPRIGARRSAYGSGIRVLPRTSEQASFVLGVPGVSRTDDRRFAVGVLSTALGGGMSSRLFQEVREKRGLAYSVYSYNGQYADAGLFGVYAGCLPKKVGEVLEICRDQLADVVANGVGEDEVSRGKSQLRGALVLGLEDTGSRMSRIGKSELLYGEMLGVDDILARIEAVTPDDVRDVATSLLKASPMLTVIGPFDEDRDFSEAVA